MDLYCFNGHELTDKYKANNSIFINCEVCEKYIVANSGYGLEFNIKNNDLKAYRLYYKYNDDLYCFFSIKKEENNSKNFTSWSCLEINNKEYILDFFIPIDYKNINSQKHFFSIIREV